MSSAMCVLGIETSCDETAASVVEAGTRVRSSVVSSQIDLHARYGGVVPELAGRAHLEQLGPVITEALVEGGVEGAQCAAVAATIGPGLVGALLVGVSHAKALALAWDVPFVGVNHLEGHLYACLLERPDLPLPAIVLLVSGGHTLLVHVEAHGSYKILGGTIDDAAGEAYDKVARVIGLGYPGGPAVDKLAASGDPGAVRLPRPLAGEDSFDFSFSGLKTAVVRRVAREPDLRPEDVAAGFQAAVVDVLVAKAQRAVVATDAKALCLAGGVAANSALRAATESAAVELGVDALLPSLAYCTDNAAMIAAAGWWRLQSDGPTSLDCGAYPNLRL